jgi:predicted alpha/beta-hydrolase family hydrolase
VNTNPAGSRDVRIVVDSAHTVSGLFDAPDHPTACYVLAHGAGAGMRHAFLAAVATQLCALGVATLRFQFPYMEKGSKRPDRPELCHATVRAAVAQAAILAPSLPLLAGGRSFGGRMASQAQAAAPLPGVRGLAFLGFPLHAAGKPSDTRAEHLFQVNVPMLFLQGTQDELAQLTLLQPLIARLGERATLVLFEHADHSFHVPARSGRKDPEVRAEVTRALADWMAQVART